jgi:serine phosphatase RsbU (regulator of sigma subunit)
MLVLHTDGISEAQNAVGEEFGMQPLRELIRQQKMREPVEVVHECRALPDKFRGSGERLDDETLLAIQLAPAANAATAQRHAYV